MTDKKFVLSIYPEASVDCEYLSGYSVYFLHKYDIASVIAGNDEDEIWAQLRRMIDRSMLRKLEQ